MTKIVKVSETVTERGLEKIADHFSDKEGDFVFISDDDMRVFEYDDLEEVTVHLEEVAEELENAEGVSVVDGDLNQMVK